MSLDGREDVRVMRRFIALLSSFGYNPNPDIPNLTMDKLHLINKNTNTRITKDFLMSHTIPYLQRLVLQGDIEKIRSILRSVENMLPEEDRFFAIERMDNLNKYNILVSWICTYINPPDDSPTLSRSRSSSGTSSPQYVPGTPHSSRSRSRSSDSSHFVPYVPGSRSSSGNSSPQYVPGSRSSSRASSRSRSRSPHSRTQYRNGGNPQRKTIRKRRKNGKP